MRLFAIRQLTGDYGLVAPNEEFECDRATALLLLERGLVREAYTPRYEVAAFIPPETKTPEPEATQAEPFRDLHMPYPEPPALVELRRQVLADAAVEEPRTPDSGRRKRGRPRRTA